MPVFGNINKTLGVGLMGVIENGGEMAKIISSSSGYMNYTYNLNYTQISWYVEDSIGLYNTYDPNKVKVVEEEPLYFDYQIGYYFLEDENNNYYSMAKIYQNYLKNKFNIVSSYDENPKLVLEALGAVTVVSNLFGVSQDKQIPLTTIDDLKIIIDEMSENNVDNVQIIYNSWINRGINQTSLAKIRMMSSLGKQSNLQALNQELEAHGYELSYAVNMVKFYKSGENGFIATKHAARTMDNSATAFHRYSYINYEFDKNTEGYYYLSTKYLDSMTKSLNKYISDNNIGNITLNDLGSSFLVDYSRSESIDAFQSKELVQKGISNLNSNLILRDAFDYNLSEASYLLDISYESSNYYTFTHTIPFKQLVLNGLINYSTSDFNNNTIDFSDVNYLKALETGSDIKYLITYQNTEQLKSTEYNYIYSSDYNNWKEEIVNLYNRYKNDVEEIQSRYIVNHEVLEEGIYKVTYEGGKIVIFNYSHSAYMYNDRIVQSNSMLII